MTHHIPRENRLQRFQDCCIQSCRPKVAFFPKGSPPCRLFPMAWSSWNRSTYALCGNAPGPGRAFCDVAVHAGRVDAPSSTSYSAILFKRLWGWTTCIRGSHGKCSQRTREQRKRRIESRWHLRPAS